MIDIKYIRENKKEVEKAIKAKGFKVDISLLLKFDEERIELRKQIEELNSERKKTAEEKNIEKGKKLKVKLAELGDQEKILLEKIDEISRKIPNIPLPEVPIGKDETENVVLREVGKKPEFDFPAKDYMELNEKLDWIDTERAGKAVGSRFGYIKNQAALLEFALIKFAFDELTKEGFVPVVPPVMIKEEMMKAMGYIDSEKDLEERYFFEKDKLFLVGTSEQSIGPMHADETFNEKDLPKRYAAFSTCFRREAGSYGKDTKGILRVHQFDKVEMFSFARPEDSRKEHEFLLSMEEKLMHDLDFPYRVVQLCSGDLSQPSAATYDIEVWLPGQNQYRETHSTSNCTDFQSRRLNIRYKPQKTNEANKANSLKAKYVHTLNGTAFAIGRMLIAIIENCQQKDGAIKIPAVLEKYICPQANTGDLKQ